MKSNQIPKEVAQNEKNLSRTQSLAKSRTILTGSVSNNTDSEAPTKNSTPQTAPLQPEHSQIEKALALINTFATGDTDTARSLLSDGYIQHNLAYGTGADAFIGSVEYLASADVKTTVNNIRVFEDGDKVFLQTIYNFAGSGEQGISMMYDEVHMVLAQGNFVLAVSEGTFGGAPTSYYDLWRVENGKITEHWDVMETVADQSTWQNENGKF